MLKRVVIKLSGEDFGTQGGDFFNDVHISDIVRQIAQVVQAGTQVAIVVGGGNIWRAKDHGSRINRVKSDQIGMLATVINGLYLAEAFRACGQKALCMTPHTMPGVTTGYSADAAVAALDGGSVVISAGGTGHPFFSTDTLTALRAAELCADMILFTKSGVDGVYDKDPKKHPDAKKYRSLSYGAAIAKNYTIADMAAFCLANDVGLHSLIFGPDTPQGIVLACKYPSTGNLSGTFMSPSAKEDFYGN